VTACADTANRGHEHTTQRIHPISQPVSRDSRSCQQAGQLGPGQASSTRQAGLSSAAPARRPSSPPPLSAAPILCPGLFCPCLCLQLGPCPTCTVCTAPHWSGVPLVGAGQSVWRRRLNSASQAPEGAATGRLRQPNVTSQARPSGSTGQSPHTNIHTPTTPITSTPPDSIHIYHTNLSAPPDRHSLPHSASGRNFFGFLTGYLLYRKKPTLKNPKTWLNLVCAKRAFWRGEA